MPTLDEIRAAIKAKIMAATALPAANVHDYERFTAEQARFRELYLYGVAPNQRIHGYHIRRIGTAERHLAVGRYVVDHSWQLRGFLGIEDADATEKAFDAEIETIRTAIRDDDTLGNLIATCINDSQAGVQVIDSGPVMFAGVLCHAARLALMTRHYL